MAKKFQRSTETDTRYERKTAKALVYRSEWGTRGSKNSKEATSITIAKHPLLAWANDIKGLLVFKGHTLEERAACLEMIQAIDNLGEFKKGEVVFDLPVESDGMWFQARIIRIA